MSTPSEQLPTAEAAAYEAAAQDSQNRVGWFRAMRTPDPLELLKANSHAFDLAYVIAYRGQYRDGFNRHNLALGEALLGDFKNYGMSHRQYRTAIEQLSKWHFATFRKTNKGTIGKLTDTRLFSIFRLPSDKQNDSLPTSSRQANDNQPTTTENEKNEKSAERANKTTESPLRFCKADTEEKRPDWNGLNTREKMLKILGNQEIAKRPDWITRAEMHPSRIEKIMDAMHADIATGRVIKNRGAYAEHLWKIAR